MEKKIKIAIETSPLSSGHAARGIGFYTKNLISALEGSDEVDVRKIQEGNNLVDYDVVHYPYFDLFFHTLPLGRQAKTVVTIHDVIPIVFPQYYPSGLKGKLRFLLQKYALKSVGAVITDSDCSKKDIVKYLNFPQDKIHVVYLAPSNNARRLEGDKWMGEIRRKYSLPEKFVLYVGDVNWNKNIPSLVKACEKIGVPLVIVGKQAVQTEFDKNHIENQSLVWLQKNYGNNGNVLRLGFIEDDDLVKIYNLADVYCQPSYYEGFGLPVLEAMACGCPVVCSKVSSLPEIAGDAALYIDPQDVNDIAAKLSEVLNDEKLRKELAEKGLNNVKRYSWNKTAQEVIGVYKKLVTG